MNMGSTKKTGRGRFFPRQEHKDLDRKMRRKEAKEEIERDMEEE